jgi:hypothetical protein
MTITILIGNSDNKLTQEEWHDFVASVDGSLSSYVNHIFFNGDSPGSASRQNHCWVAAMESKSLGSLRGQLRDLASNYRQDSIAIVVGETELVEPL